MQKMKIGFIGNGCTGKTTSMFNLFSRLKREKVHVGYVSDVARGAPFNPALFDTDPAARLHSLFNQLAHECAHTVREDVHVLLCERTALDWYMYYLWTCENVGVQSSRTIADLVGAWMESYTHLFYFDDSAFDYVADGFRPASSTLRDEMKVKYHEAYSLLLNKFPGKVTYVTGEIDQRVAFVEQEGVRCVLRS
jgi:hypothetical protein